MTDNYFNVESLDRPGALAITQSESAARDLQVHYGIMKKNQNVPVWEKPHISSFYRWAILTWENCWPESQLLHPVQETILYKSVIDSSDELNLLSTFSTARTCRRAASLCNQYEIDVTHDAFTQSPDTHSFLLWEKEVRKRMSVMGWVTYEKMLCELVTFITSGKVALPEIIYLIGFIALTPIQTSLFGALSSLGVKIKRIPPNPISNDVSLVRHSDQSSQFYEAAAWVNRHLNKYISSPQDAPHIAVIVADLDKNRSLVDEAFYDVVSPHAKLPVDSERRIPWRFSNGKPLDAYPLIHSGFTLLQLSLTDNDISLITRILRSPFIADALETESRAALDLALRELSIPSLTFKALLSVANVKLAERLPLFIQRLEGLHIILKESPSHALPSDWANNFYLRLDTIGWLGSGKLTSSEYQLKQTWEECLSTFSAMDRQLGEITHGRALAWFREILHSRQFQPRTQYQAPVTILDLWDLPGLHFDKAIVLGLDALTFPKAAEPNPFIPIELQQNAQIPTSSPELSLIQAEKLLDYVNNIADEILLCCPMNDAFGNSVAPTPLIAGWPDSYSKPNDNLRAIDGVIKQGPQTYFPDTDVAPPVINPALEEIHGGVTILKEIAIMPFIAFARGRLELTPFPIPNISLDKATQGTLLHRVLECFWKRNKTSDKLRTFTDPDLQEEINICVDSTLSESGILSEWRYGVHLVQLETTRIKKMIFEWLLFEKERNDPFEVMYVELPVKSVINGLPIDMRLDRIDKVSTSDGDKYLIIDYKTGDSISASNWDIENLTEPQLPLYATSDILPKDISHIDGIAFAHIVPGRSAFYTRLSWTDSFISTNKTYSLTLSEWNSMLEQWKTELNKLASLFMEGNTEADYRELVKSHFHGDLIPLVRENLDY